MELAISRFFRITIKQKIHNHSSQKKNTIENTKNTKTTISKSESPIVTSGHNKKEKKNTIDKYLSVF